MCSRPYMRSRSSWTPDMQPPGRATRNRHKSEQHVRTAWTNKDRSPPHRKNTMAPHTLDGFVVLLKLFAFCKTKQVNNASKLTKCQPTWRRLCCQAKSYFTIQPYKSQIYKSGCDPKHITREACNSHAKRVYVHESWLLHTFVKLRNSSRSGKGSQLGKSTAENRGSSARQLHLDSASKAYAYLRLKCSCS